MFSTRRRSLIAMSSFAAYRKPGRRDDNGDTGNANAGGGGGTGTGTGQGNGTGDQSGGNTGGSGQQGGQSGGQQQGGNQGGQNGGQGDAQTVDQLPGWAQRVISDLRRENAAKRTSGNDGGQGQQQNGQQGGQNNAGQQQGQGQQNTSTTANDEAIEAAQATARDSVVQLAAYRAASGQGADPDLLLDSLTFVNEKLKKLDPTDGEFNSKLKAAIKKAVEDNPKLKAVQAAGRSGGEFTGGPGGTPNKPKSLAAAVTAHLGGG